MLSPQRIDQRAVRTFVEDGGRANPLCKLTKSRDIQVKAAEQEGSVISISANLAQHLVQARMAR